MIEIKQINTGVADLLALKVPEGAHSFTSYRSSITDTNKLAFITTDITCIDLPPGNWTPLGVDTELTEEQCAGLVSKVIVDGITYYGYISKDRQLHTFDTAKEAFASLMQANGCYSANPLGEKPKPFSYVKWQVQARAEAEWQQAEANTGTWLVLKRLS